jgi:threonine synthase
MCKKRSVAFSGFQPDLLSKTAKRETMEKAIAYYSTNFKSPALPFHKALIKGQAPDKGLYMPKTIPVIDKALLKRMQNMAYHEMAAVIIGKFLQGVIDPQQLAGMVEDAYNYPIPLEKVVNKKYVMRLDRGPTASFKDFAGRMMGRLMNYFVEKSKGKLLILTATSGDTGSAIANAFYGLENIHVVVLFPINEVTPRQRKQMTTLGKNISILGLDAKFDDCQALVKQAFADEELAPLYLSSANSINIGRLIPQIVYYFYAYSKLTEKPGEEKVIFSVPSGNFGDMMGGILALKMGLPVERFIIATNANDEFLNFMQSGSYHKIEPSRNCISSAMNVGHPSNLARLFALYGGAMDEKGNIIKSPDLEMMNRELFAVSVSDDQTKATIKSAWEKYRLLLEPHGAVGWKGLELYFAKHPDQGQQRQLSITLETAHPAKFPEQINQILGLDPELPPSLTGLEDKKEAYNRLENNYTAFKSYLLKNFG